MAEPRQKSLDFDQTVLYRHLPQWILPAWVDASFWRHSVRNQPLAIIARDKLITYAQALPFTITATDPKEDDKLEKDIAYYQDFVLREFDEILDLLWQDALDLPVGGNMEVVRWPGGHNPKVELNGQEFTTTRPWDRGHVYKIVNVDGATLRPIYDNKYHMVQVVQGDINKHIFFTEDEMVRLVLTPRPEWQLKGYGMPPPQRIYLALNMLYRSDVYYANLLLDTPEAGILDLGDMKKSVAKEWVESYQDLMSGIDPMKIAVLYEHHSPVKWIPYTRPPAEMALSEQTLKYARIAAAGYWLSVTDLGLTDGQRTLAGAIREQKEARLTGHGIVKEKTANLFNKRGLLPPWLKFSWVEKDDESMAAIGRARLTNAQAFKVYIEAGVMTEEEAQAQSVRDGLITVELEKPKEKEAPPQLQPPHSAGALPAPGQEGEEEAAQRQADKVPPSDGGRGDVGTQKANINYLDVQTQALKSSLTPQDLTTKAGDLSVSAAPVDSPYFDQLAGIFKQRFDDILKRASGPRLEKLIKIAARKQFDLTSKAIYIVTNVDELQELRHERTKAWLGLDSVFADMPQVIRSDAESVEAIEKALEEEDWWIINEDETALAVGVILAMAYSEGAELAAVDVIRYAYTEGLIRSPDLIGSFDLKNPRTLAEIEQNAATLVRRVNDGTKSFIRRAIAQGVDEGLASPDIAARIQEGEGLETILKRQGFTDGIITKAKSQIGDMLTSRINSIVNTEINRAETNGRVGQWEQMGLKRKRWEHTGPDSPCAICTAHIALGFVPITYKFDSIFGSKDTLGPPGHPGVCHCHIAFDEKEVLKQWDDIEIWLGQ